MSKRIMDLSNQLTPATVGRAPIKTAEEKEQELLDAVVTQVARKVRNLLPGDKLIIQRTEAPLLGPDASFRLEIKIK